MLKILTSIILLACGVSAFALDCRPQEEALSGFGLGYLSLIDVSRRKGSELAESNPILLWWIGDAKDDYDYGDEKNFRKYFGVDSLKKKSMFIEARKTIALRKADIYVLAWMDRIVYEGKSVDVIKVSIGQKNWSYAYDGAVLASDTSQPGWELGCSANLIESPNKKFKSDVKDASLN